MPACHGESPCSSLFRAGTPLRSVSCSERSSHGRLTVPALLHCRVTPLHLCRKVIGYSPALLLWHCTGSPPQAPRGESCLHCRSVPKCRAIRGQVDLVVTADTDCLLRRCLCHPYAHEACACLYAYDIRPRRLSSPRRYALRSDPRKLLSSLAVYGSLRPQACPLRFSTRTHGKGIDIYLPPYGSPLPAPLSTQSVSAPSRNKAGSVSMCSPLRSKHSLNTARVNKEQADTALRCGIGLHVGRNTARGIVCRVPSRNQKGASSRTQPHIPQKSKRGKGTRSIGRTGGLPTEKGEIFPFNPL